MKAKYVVFGDGLLGSFFRVVPDTVVLSRQQCDISDKDALKKVISHYKPHTVINTAGIVPKNKVPIPTLFKVNSFAPHYIADVCYNKCGLIHISTNCVFEGKEDSNYTEDRDADAKDIYGMSKLLGEPTRALVLRTSFVGLPDPKGRGLLSWLDQNDSVVGYDKVLWNGMTTKALVDQVILYAKLGITGIRHVYSYTQSKYHLLQMVNEVFFGGRKIIIKESDTTDSPHIESKTLGSLYVTGFVPTPVEKQLRELAHDIKR